jgi:uncharacterized protein YkwD
LQAEALPGSAWLKTHARAVFACLLSAVAISVLPTPADAHARAGAGFDRVERKIVHRINAIRSGYGLKHLRLIGALGRSSDYHCADMLGNNFFAHTSSNGESFEQRVDQFRPSRRIGETLAYVSGTARRGQARRIVDMWMNSPPHRASLLSPAFRRIGIARRNGTLGGSRVTVFTADLASKR